MLWGVLRSVTRCALLLLRRGMFVVYVNLMFSITHIVKQIICRDAGMGSQIIRLCESTASPLHLQKVPMKCCYPTAVRKNKQGPQVWGWEIYRTHVRMLSRLIDPTHKSRTNNAKSQYPAHIVLSMQRNIVRVYLDRNICSLNRQCRIPSYLQYVKYWNTFVRKMTARSILCTQLTSQ